METKTIGKTSHLSQFDRMAIDLLKTILPDQKMKLYDGEGGIWSSEAVDLDGQAITTIKKNDIVKAKVVYDYENSEEVIFYY